MDTSQLIAKLAKQLRRKRLSKNWAARTLEISSTQLVRLIAGEATPDKDLQARIHVVLEALEILEKIAI